MIGVSFNGCAGWLERGRGDTGVVICPAQGFEELCSRRTLAVLAQRLADAGITVLRFDYPGTADSAGTHTDPDSVASWRKSVDDAIAYMREEAGIERVVLVGLRLGGTLAALAAEGRDVIAATVLLAPIVAGRTYVREMMALRQFIETAPVAQGAPAVADGSLEIGGFIMTPDTVEDLNALDLQRLSRLPPRVLVLPQPASVANERLVTQLTDLAKAADTSIETHAFSGYDRMICEPTASVLPEDDLDTVTDWIAGIAEETTQRSPAANVPRTSGVQSAHWHEQGLTFGTHDHLVGVLCEPARPRGDRPAVLFLNNGMDYHAGWARSTVEHARNLAELGIASLRIDSAGIGDSRTAPGQTGDAIYREQAIADARAGADLLIGRGYAAPVVTGGCSGAYTAFHLVRTDKRIKRAVIRNLQVFHWTPEIGYRVRMGVAAHAYKLTEKRRMSDDEVRPMDVMSSRIRSLAMRVSTRIRTALHAPVFGLGGPFSSATVATTRDVLGWFRDLSARGARITLVYSAGDPGIAELERHAGPGATAIMNLPGVRITVIPDADHNMTPKHARDALLGIFRETIGDDRTA